MEVGATVAKRIIHDAKKWVSSKWVWIGAAVLFCVLLAALIVHRFSPKSTGINCAFQTPSQETLPETSGDSFKVDTCVKLEVAATDSQRVLGLSGRQSMDRDTGLLFDFGKPDEYCMWMKDMNFALDMIWLNEEKEIVHIEESVTPDTYPKSFCGPGSARYVVEVNKDVIKSADLHVGQTIRF